jgi:predicted phosphodiesterase
MVAVTAASLSTTAYSEMLGYKLRLRCLERSSLHFQIMSDLHLEAGDQYESFQIPVRAPYLILAGDIGRLQDYEKYLSFIATQCAKFEMVCLVLGNHEFYGISRSEGLNRAQKLEKEEGTLGRLKVLNRTRLNVGSSLCILGCTLQSNIGPQSRVAVEGRVKDFQRIPGWTVDQHNDEHEKDLEWLRSEIRSISGGLGCPNRAKRILVITHHAPIKKGSSHPKHDENLWTDAFATDLIGVHEEVRRVQWWIFGHTHYTTQWRQQGITLISNQRGYILDPAQRRRSPNVFAYKDARQIFISLFKQTERHFDPRKCIAIRV